VEHHRHGFLECSRREFEWHFVVNINILVFCCESNLQLLEFAHPAVLDVMFNGLSKFVDFVSELTQQELTKPIIWYARWLTDVQKMSTSCNVSAATTITPTQNSCRYPGDNVAHVCRAVCRLATPSATHQCSDFDTVEQNVSIVIVVIIAFMAPSDHISCIKFALSSQG
jgi:hypothetical protein